MTAIIRPEILCINSGGIGDLHGVRARRLVADLDAEITFHDVDKSKSRRDNSRQIWHLLTSRRWSLIYQESTGISGGINLIRAAKKWGQKYVISTGDPVGGFFKTVKGPAVGALFEKYERSLYRNCAGFIGWTPYLTGMALKMGARRAATIEGAVDVQVFKPFDQSTRGRLKGEFGLDPEHMVCGVVGSLKWTPRQSYCYGLELVKMIAYVERTDISLLIVGEGDGRKILEEAVPEKYRSRVVFTGRMPEDRVVDALNAMDIGFLTQTLDGLGNFRLTTKLPEYLACGLPIAMSPIPGYYDYALEAGWPLPPLHPSTDEFHRGCARLVDSVRTENLDARRIRGREIAERVFDYAVIRPRFTAFLQHIIEN